MYYYKILRTWVIDPIDYFLISALIASLIASYLKNYLSEKAALKRLKRSIIAESKLRTSKTPLLKSKESKLMRIYRFAIQTHGGDIYREQEFPSDDAWELAAQVQNIVTRLALYLKQKESRGMLKIFYKSGRLILELIFYQCNIGLIYPVIEGIVASPQVIVIAIVGGGTAGFTVSWFAAGGALIATPLILATLLGRSIGQQVKNYREYIKFRNMVRKILGDEKIQETLHAVFVEVEDDAVFDKLQVSSRNLEENPIVKSACEGLGIRNKGSIDLDDPESLESLSDLLEKAANIDKSTESFKKAIKEKLKEDFDLIENPTDAQLNGFINGKRKRKRTGKTTYFSDFIKNMPDSDSDIIDVDIIKKSIRIKND